MCVCVSGELLECLRVHFEELEPKCHNVVFKRDLRQMLDSSVDYGLRVLCDSMRLQYCANEAESSLFVCLKRSFRLQGSCSFVLSFFPVSTYSTHYCINLV